jgi:transketolase
MEDLEKISKDIRNDIVDMIYSAGSGHPGGSLSCVEILVALYHKLMNLNLDNEGSRIDKFILSKGHASSCYYAVLSSKGYISHDDLKTFRKYDSYLEGHPCIKINGVDVSSGSLGQGLSIANGMALSKKISGKEGNVYCLVGDGEIEEGQIWEACMSSSKYNLNNLILFVDNNGLQIDGTIKDVKNVDNLEEKFNSFGFYVQRINGHNFDEILTSVLNAKKSNKPNVIIANTIKGKGISFMENKAEWHGKKLTDEEYNLSKAELK